MKFLVDANVLSEATKPEPDALVLQWLSEHEEELAVNPIVVGELEYGILCLPGGKRRTRLMHWFTEALKHLPLLEVDDSTAHIWAQLLADLKRKGQTMAVKDSLIAASAKQYELTLATRNVADFRHCGIRWIDPFDAHR
jgi:predicted nucleic acid-binding protein